jgi:hypothetical protein
MRNDQTASARYVLTDDLPNGEILVPIDSPEGTVMAVRTGYMHPDLVAAVNRSLEQMTRCGLWTHSHDAGEDDG